MTGVEIYAVVGLVILVVAAFYGLIFGASVLGDRISDSLRSRRARKREAPSRASYHRATKEG